MDGHFLCLPTAALASGHYYRRRGRLARIGRGPGAPVAQAILEEAGMDRAHLGQDPRSPHSSRKPLAKNAGLMEGLWMNVRQAAQASQPP